MLMRRNGGLKRVICVILAFGVICFIGCQKKELPQPDFPLSEKVVNDTLKQLGLSWIISESETSSSREGHVSYALRNPEKLNDFTNDPLLMAGISSADIEEGRLLLTTFATDSVSKGVDPRTLPFKWEDWKQQIVFATLLYGGFGDEEEVYRAFSGNEIPEVEGMIRWDAQLQAAYCRVSLTSLDSDIPGAQRYILWVEFYPSKTVYQKLTQDMEDAKKALEGSPTESPN